MFRPVSAKPDFVAQEHEILAEWRDRRTFERTWQDYSSGRRWRQRWYRRLRGEDSPDGSSAAPSSTPNGTTVAIGFAACPACDTSG